MIREATSVMSRSHHVAIPSNVSAASGLLRMYATTLFITALISCSVGDPSLKPTCAHSLVFDVRDRAKSMPVAQHAVFVGFGFSARCAMGAASPSRSHFFLRKVGNRSVVTLGSASRGVGRSSHSTECDRSSIHVRVGPVVRYRMRSLSECHPNHAPAPKPVCQRGLLK